MDIYDPIGKALNLSPIPQSSFITCFIPDKSVIGIGGFKGKKHTEESKLSISKSKKGQGKGKVVSEETKQKLKNAWSKRGGMTEEHRKKLSKAASESNTKRKFDPNNRLSIEKRQITREKNRLAKLCSTS
jgi:hypothetical protein